MFVMSLVDCGIWWFVCEVGVTSLLVALTVLVFMVTFKGCLFSVCIWVDAWVGWYVVVVYFPILLG